MAKKKELSKSSGLGDRLTKLRSEKKLSEYSETILRIAPESRAIDEISAVFHESPRRNKPQTLYVHDMSTTL